MAFLSPSSPESLLSGTLYLIPTPIGNVEDMSPRCRRLITEVDILAAEDTRETRSLLTVLGIARPAISYHDHNESQKAPHLVAELLAGKNVGLVSDAGTPLMDDPGHHLVQFAIAAGIPVASIPGPSAAITALVGSGLPVARWCYLGFLSRNDGHRRKDIAVLRDHPGTLVLLESPHRLDRCLHSLMDVLGDRQAVVAVNLSKKGETWHRGLLSALCQLADAGDLARGECTVVVAGAPEKEDRSEDWKRARQLSHRLRKLGLPLRSIRDVVVGTFGLPSQAVYRLLLDEEGEE